MKKNCFIIIFLLCLQVQSQEKKVLLKEYSFNEIEQLQKVNTKPVVVYIYTDWCKFCFAMKKNTFKNMEVIKLLNNQFYFVTLNAENKKDISFLGNTFVYQPTGTDTGIHQLANALAATNTNISYPTTTILNSKFEIDLQKTGYLNYTDFITILNEIIKL